MLRHASPEFVTLCRSQATLLAEGFGAAVSAVYVMNESAQAAQSELVPIVVYPDDAAAWLDPVPLSLPAGPSRPSAVDAARPLLESASEVLPLTDPQLNVDPTMKGWDRSTAPMSFYQPQRILLPLIHNDRVLGLLVVVRDTLEWTAHEQTQLEGVAETLAMARILDQRSQGLRRLNYQHRSLQDQQHQNLSNLLHQFRNPLTTLRTLGTLLIKRLQPADTNRQVAESILQQSDRLEALLSQFDGAIDPIDLGHASLEPLPPSAGAAESQMSPKALPPASQKSSMDLRLQPCWIADILQPLLRSAVGIEEERQLSLQAHIPTSLPPVRADAAALREVFSNLIDNALKYTPHGGVVQVGIHRQATAIPGQYEQQVFVSDSGPGIPESDLERIFVRHYRGIQAATDIPGTGLGLAIARDLVEQMHGRIQAHSPALDAPPQSHGQPITPGSTFVVTLPENASVTNAESLASADLNAR